MATVSIADDLYDRTAARVDQTEFESVDEYTAFVLETVLDQLETVTDGTAGDRGEVLNKLRDLGYLE